MTIRILTSVPDTAVNNGIHHHWIDQVGHVPFEIKPENLENQNMKNQSFILIFYRIFLHRPRNKFIHITILHSRSTLLQWLAWYTELWNCSNVQLLSKTCGLWSNIDGRLWLCEPALRMTCTNKAHVHPPIIDPWGGFPIEIETQIS